MFTKNNLINLEITKNTRNTLINLKNVKKNNLINKLNFVPQT